MSIKGRLSKLEQADTTIDSLAQQAKDIWLVFDTHLTDEQAETIAAYYRKQGLSEITWESLVQLDYENMRDL